jgi:hypothetical protein
MHVLAAPKKGTANIRRDINLAKNIPIFGKRLTFPEKSFI